MPSSATELAGEIRKTATVAGLAVTGDDNRLEGEVESIRAKWFLGKRTVQYRMSCRLDEATHTVAFHESLVERTVGMAPPTFSVEKTTQKGTRVDIERKDVSAGGGGTVSYGGLRDEVERLVTAAGWTFELKLLRAG
jgi:hypothetical protein